MIEAHAVIFDSALGEVTTDILPAGMEVKQLYSMIQVTGTIEISLLKYHY